MIDPKLPDTVWILYYRLMAEGWERQFFIREDRARVMWESRPGSRLYEVAVEGRWKEVD